MAGYDVVVIGAGNGGLTAASALARSGKKVLLMEKHNVPGGCATSFCRGRFEFEVALHQLSGLGLPDQPGPLRGLLQRLGVLDYLEFIPMENLYRIIVPQELDIILPADRQKAISVLKERFPAEAENIERFFDLVYRFFSELVQAFYLRDPDVSPEKYPIYFEYALKNTSEVLDAHFSDPLLKLAVAVYWCYMGVPPSRLTFSDMAALLFSYLEFKPYHLKGGSQALSNALAEQILAAGGEIRFNCRAAKIDVDGGQVIGVVTEDGEAIPCRAVVSNVSTIDTYVELIDREHVPDQQITLLSGSTVGPSSFTLYVGLDCEPGEVGITEVTNFICPDADMEAAYRATKEMDPNKDSLLLTCYNLLDSSFSPPGTSQVVIVDLKYAEPWLLIPPSEYARKKFEYADVLLRRIDELFPGFRDHIEEIEVATPITHMRFLGHPGGAIYGFDQFAKDKNLFTAPRSPIAGLYFAGSWAGDGGFQPTLTSGGAAARAVLRYLREGEEVGR